MSPLRPRRAKRLRHAADVADDWIRALFQAKLWRGNRWLGVPILQWPTDLFVLQEILFRERPLVVVETGTNRGGSAVFFASMLALVHGDPRAGRVITVDREMPREVVDDLARHPQGGDRILCLEGDSVRPDVVGRVRDAVEGESRVLVFLDSDHAYAHVRAELRAYAPLVPPGGSLLVFDTVCRMLADLPGVPDSWAQDNPLRAVEEFLAEEPDFERNREGEKLLVTFAPGGFLRRRP